MCDFFHGVDNNRSSIIASQYFLLCKQSNIAFMYDCQIEGEIFNPIGIIWYKCDVLPKYGSILQYLFEFSNSLSEWNASFKSNTNSTLNLELPITEKVSFSKGCAKLFLAILTFKYLKSTLVLSCATATFLLINITGLE